MSTNLNSIYSSFINNIGSTQKSSHQRNEINCKDIGDGLFAKQLENAKKTDTYLNEIKNCVPNTVVTIKSMTAGDIQKYYKKWQKQSIDYLGFKHNIIISPKVLENMEKDPKYAEQMLLKIKKAAIPEGFGNATIYEYKVIVRDDGEIETLACADFMNGKNQRVNDDAEKKKKNEKKKLELIYLHRRLYDKWEAQNLLEEEINITQFIGTQYLLHMGVGNKIKKANRSVDLK